MNIRTSTIRSTTSAALIGTLLSVFSINASAQSGATLESRAPQSATLLPAMRVSASIANPGQPVRWDIAKSAPTQVTLMPTLRITPDAEALAVTTLPTLRVVAQVKPLEDVQNVSLAMAMGSISAASSVPSDAMSKAAKISN